MGNVVGIDLGTTNSVAAFKFADVEIVPFLERLEMKGVECVLL